MACKYVKEGNVYVLPFNNADHVDLYTLCLQKWNRFNQVDMSIEAWCSIQQNVVREFREKKQAEATATISDLTFE